MLRFCLPIHHYYNTTALTLNPLPNDKILAWSELKVLADDNISNVTEKLKFVVGWMENIMGKGENAGFQHFLLFP